MLADLLTVFGLSGLVFFLSQYLQLVQGRPPFQAGLAELPAAIGAVGAGLIAGSAARRYSVRAVVSGGLAAVGLALGVLTLLNQSTGYTVLGSALLVVGVGAGFSFTVTADVILQRARSRPAPRPRSPRRRRARRRPRHRPARLHRDRRLRGLHRPRGYPAGPMTPWAARWRRRQPCPPTPRRPC